MNKVNEWKSEINNRLFIVIVLFIFASQSLFNVYLFKKHNALRMIFALSIFMFVYSIIKRDFFLFFLSDTVYPCDSLTVLKPSNAFVNVHVSNVKPNSKIVYWATEPNDLVIDNPFDAYGKYKNSGVALSDNNGKVTLSVRQPSMYKVPYKSEPLRRHVHYRECFGNGLMGSVKTVFL